MKDMEETATTTTEAKEGGEGQGGIHKVGETLHEVFGDFVSRIEMEREQLLLEIESAEAYRDQLVKEVEAMSTIRRKWEKVISLNVGGTRFDVSLSTLTQTHPQSMLAVMFSGRHDVVWDAKGCVFIDRDPDLFKQVLSFLRVGPEAWKEIKPVNDPPLMARLRIEFDFFQLPFESKEEKEEEEERRRRRSTGFVGGGTLLTKEHGDILRRWQGDEGRTWVLLYKGSRDGFHAHSFHRRCDKKGPTFTILRTEQGGYLLGGYTSLSWDPSTSYLSMTDHSSFLFTLTNPYRLPPTHFVVASAARAIRYSPYGPCFGGGNDLFVHFTHKDAPRAECSVAFSSYRDTTGIGPYIYASSPSFYISEIEVYGLLTA